MQEILSKKYCKEPIRKKKIGRLLHFDRYAVYCICINFSLGSWTVFVCKKFPLKQILLSEVLFYFESNIFKRYQSVWDIVLVNILILPQSSCHISTKQSYLFSLRYISVSGPFSVCGQDSFINGFCFTDFILFW